MRKFDARYVEITDDVRKTIVEAYNMHGSYLSLARTLNFETGRSAKKLVNGEAKHINKDKLELLKCLLGEPT